MRVDGIRDLLIPAGDCLRAACGQIERIVADDLWMLPSDREMLFIE